MAIILPNKKANSELVEEWRPLKEETETVYKKTGQ